jgi:hypothetical protein
VHPAIRRRLGTVALVPSLASAVLAASPAALPAELQAQEIQISPKPGHDQYEIVLLDRRWVPDLQDVPVKRRVLTDSRSRRASRAAQRGHFLVQLHENPSLTRRDELTRLGVELMDPLPGRAWIAAISLDRDIAEIADIRFLAPWTAELKTHPRVRADLWPPWTLDSTRPGWVRLIVQFHADVVVDAANRLLGALGSDPGHAIHGLNGLVVTLPLPVIPKLAERDEVRWIEHVPPPATPFNDGVRKGLNGANHTGGALYGLDGFGVRLFVYEIGTVRPTHATFVAGDGGSSRATVLPIDLGLYDDHATHVAGTAAGDGSGAPCGTGRFECARGVAPAASVLSKGALATTLSLESEYERARNTYGADLANNSWGTPVADRWWCDWEGDYDATSALIDGIVRGDNPRVADPLIVVWANGNERNQGTPPGRCGTNYATTPAPACAKNAISVGAIYSDGLAMTPFSSWGPCDDGRLRPLVVAPGDEYLGSNDRVFSSLATSDDLYGSKGGTSMAAPAVAGAVSLLIQQWRQLGFGSANDRPLPALVRALLVHTARDLGQPGPDYVFGYGAVDAASAIETLRAGTGQFESSGVANWTTGELVDSAPLEVPFEVPADAAEFRATLAWDDRPGTLGSSLAIVNDLDVELVDPSGSIFQPFVMDPADASRDATVGRNARDNQEQVVVRNPLAGSWMIRLVTPQGVGLLTPPQTFAFVYGTKPGEGILSSLTDTFESDAGSFTLTGAQRAAAPAPGHGSWSLKFAPEAGVSPGAERDITIPAGVTRAELSYHAYVDSSASSTDDLFVAFLPASGGNGFETLDRRGSGWPLGRWMQHVTSLSAWAGQTVRLRFLADAPSLNRPTFWIDDFTVRFWRLPRPTVSSVSPETIPNVGVAILAIEGAHFREHMSARLFRTGAEIQASTVRFINSNRIEATFNLAGDAAGPWNLEASHHPNDGGQSDIEPDAISLIQATASSVSLLDAAVNVPEDIGSHVTYARLRTGNGQVLPSPVVVNYSVVGGTASAGSDFSSFSGQITFATGSADGALRSLPAITIVNDGIPEPNETFSIVLGSATGAVVGIPGTQTVTILDGSAALSVASVDPKVGINTGPATLTIKGTGFRSGMRAKLTNAGVEVHDTSRVVSSPTQMSATFNLAGLGISVWTVRVWDPSTLQEAFLPSAFTVTAPGPNIDTVSPSQAENTGPRDLLIIGANFFNGMTARLVRSGYADIVDPAPQALSPTWLNARLDLTGVQPGRWSVVITHHPNDGGGSDVLPDGFLVMPPSPTIASIEPSTVTNAGPVALTLRGSSYRAGMTARLVKPNLSDIPASTIQVVSPSELVAIFDVGGVATTDWSVRVRHDLAEGGQEGALSNALIITAPPPVLTGVSPGSAPDTGGVDVLLQGAGFIGGMSARLVRAGFADIASTPVFVNGSTSANTRFELSGATPGLRDVVVTHSPNDGGQSSTLAGGFFVTAPAPAISALDPTEVPSGTSAQITIWGGNFREGMTVRLAAPGLLDLFANYVEFLEPGQLRATFDLTAAATGTRDVIATHHSSDGGQSATLAGAFSIVAPCPTISLAPTGLPSATRGAAYVQWLTAAGGIGPYVFETAAGLPPGLGLDPSGLLSGTPTEAGIFSLVVTASDAGGCEGTRHYDLGVSCPLMGMSPGGLPIGAVGQPFGHTLTATGGIAPYQFLVDAGVLPPGIHLSVDGVLSGTLDAPGDYRFTVRATDVGGCAHLQSYTVSVGWPLTVGLAGTGAGVVSSNPRGIDCSTPEPRARRNRERYALGKDCSEIVRHTAAVVLTPAARAGSAFVSWSGACTGAGPCEAVMDGAKAVTARFEAIHPLSVVISGSGGGSVSSVPAGIQCGADCAEWYRAGTAVSLAALPDDTSSFTGWGGSCTGIASCHLTVDGAALVTAEFTRVRAVLEVVTYGDGTGRVQSTPAAVDCRGTCVSQLAVGTELTLVPIADPDSRFIQWSGACPQQPPECALTMEESKSVGALFLKHMPILYVSKWGAGRGMVTSVPAGIDCPAACDRFEQTGTCAACGASFTYATAVTLTAVPVTGSIFGGWIGCGSVDGPYCMVTMDAGRSVTAAFVPESSP